MNQNVDPLYFDKLLSLRRIMMALGNKKRPMLIELGSVFWS